LLIGGATVHHGWRRSKKLGTERMAAGEDRRPGVRGARRPGKRAGLDVDQIIATAKTLPLEGLSMQSLADALKVDRKALHYHVKDRQSLFELVARDAFSQHLAQRSVAEAADWKAASRNYARSLAASAVAVAELADYLWFSDVMSGLSLEPVEALFRHLHEAGFPDEEAVRLVTVLATVCLGHARDLAQARKESTRTRPGLLKSALDAKERPGFSNLERISALAVNTYGQEQLDFSIDLILDGADASLARLTGTG
jgi:TetR/AcrR family tetracycline transcriptional repressor